MLLHPKPVRADRLTWIPENRRFVGEMSDIGGFGRVWDDACDEGLTLVSRYPGLGDVVFAVWNTVADREGDILYWDLRPARNPDAVPFTVRIFND